MEFEKLEVQGNILAEVLWNSASVGSTKFYSQDNSELQLGLMSHKAGFIESAHYHPELDRARCATQQAFVVLQGRVLVDFFNPDGSVIKTYQLGFGDSILIKDGIHRIRVEEDSRCITIKQGPFLGPDVDKIEVTF